MSWSDELLWIAETSPAMYNIKRRANAQAQHQVCVLFGKKKCAVYFV